MTRLIDANALRKAFKNHPLCNDVWLQYSREIIDNAPTVEPERLKGKWIEYNTACHHYKCDQCNADYNTLMLKPNFCPNCGVDMRKGAE